MSGEELRAAAQGLVDSLEYVPGSALGGKIALVRAALAAPSTPEPSGPDEADLIRLSIRDLVRELAETVHQTGGVRDHVDTTQKKGWTVAGIETCGDPLCVDALQFLRAAPSTEPALDVERSRAIEMYAADLLRERDSGELYGRTVDLLQAALNGDRDAILARLAESQP